MVFGSSYEKRGLQGYAHTPRHKKKIEIAPPPYPQGEKYAYIKMINQSIFVYIFFIIDISCLTLNPIKAKHQSSGFIYLGTALPADSRVFMWLEQFWPPVNNLDKIKSLECQVSALFTMQVDAEQTNTHDMIKNNIALFSFIKA